MGNWMRNFTFFIMILFAQGIGALIEKHGDAHKITEGGYHVTQLCPSNGCNDGGDLIPKVLSRKPFALSCSFQWSSWSSIITVLSRCQSTPSLLVCLSTSPSRWPVVFRAVASTQPC